MTTFDYVYNPAIRLVEPEDPGNVVNKQVEDSANWIAGPFNDLFEMLTGRNLLADLQNLVNGDWACCYKLRDALNCSYWALCDLSEHLHSTTAKLPESWRGNAAEAYSYFVGAREAELARLRGSMQKLRDMMSTIIRGCEDMAHLIVSRINDLANTVAGLAVVGGVTNGKLI